MRPSELFEKYCYPDEHTNGIPEGLFRYPHIEISEDNNFFYMTADIIGDFDKDDIAIEVRNPEKLDIAILTQKIKQYEVRSDLLVDIGNSKINYTNGIIDLVVPKLSLKPLP